MKIILLIIAVWLYLPISTSAHVLETSNEIGAVIHIDPEDDPIVNEPSVIYFEITDKSGKFSLNSCSCVVTISNSETELIHQSLITPVMNYTFPSAGVYTIKLSGKPTTANNFKEFTLSWDFRVTRTKSFDSNPNNNYLLAISGIVAAIVITIIAFVGRNIYKKFWQRG